MSKERLSVSVDAEVEQYLRQDHINASGLVNDLVKRYMNGDAGENALHEYRIQRLKDEAEEAETIAQRKREMIEELQRKTRQKKKESREDMVDTFLEKGASIPADPDNPMIQQYAEKLEKDPIELAEMLAEEYGKEVME